MINRWLHEGGPSAAAVGLCEAVLRDWDGSLIGMQLASGFVSMPVSDD